MARTRKSDVNQITEIEKAAADKELRAKQHEVKYDLRDFTIDYIVQQFNEGLFYIPEYQREFVWRNEQQSRFIESLLLGLPIPMMFVAEMDDGRLEIVDGAQRIQTLEAFKAGDLVLGDLKRLPSVSRFRFSDLPVPQQRKFDTKALRLVVLEETTTSELRKEIFDRVNTSGSSARPSEVRRGTYAGPLMEFVRSCANDPLFLKLCPITVSMVKRRENEELVLRFFAYSDRYRDFRHDVDSFLDKYVEDNRENFDKARMESEFRSMLGFVDRFFPHGFAKSGSAKSTPRVRFEAISVGCNLALRQRPGLVPSPVKNWLESGEFLQQTTTHASNSGPRLCGRVEFVRDQLIGEPSR